MSPYADKIYLDQYFRHSEGVYSSELGTETVLLHHTEGVYFGLKGVGVQIWPLLEKPKKFCEIISALEPLFESRPKSLDADIEAFLSQLLEAKLIVGQYQL